MILFVLLRSLGLVVTSWIRTLCSEGTSHETTQTKYEITQNNHYSSNRNWFCSSRQLFSIFYRPLRGLEPFHFKVPGVSLRFTPGFMLSSAPRTGLERSV